MTFVMSTAQRNSQVNNFTGDWDIGAGTATIEVRTGGKPATPGDAATGTLLVTWALAEPPWGAAAGGSAALDATPVISAVAVAAGTAGWWRAKASDGSTIGDGTAGGSGSGADLILDNPVIALGQTVNLASGTVTQPA